MEAPSIDNQNHFRVLSMTMQGNSLNPAFCMNMSLGRKKKRKKEKKVI
jgi:hypothetical protein